MSSKSEPIPVEQIAAQILDRIADWRGWTRQQTVTAVLAVGLSMLVCVSSGLIALGQAADTPSPTFAPLPIVSASDALDTLKRAGVPLINVQKLSVPNAAWNARQGLQFEVRRGDSKGVFLLLSYDTRTGAGVDAYKASSGDKYQKWNLTQTSNVLLLASPDSSASLSSEIVGDLAASLVMPYRPFLSTATPKP